MAKDFAGFGGLQDAGFLAFVGIKEFPDGIELADEVLGDEEIHVTDLGKLKYITAVMRESLRLGPTAPIRAVSTNEDITVGNGKYFLKKGTIVVVNTDTAQRDPHVYGQDVRALPIFYSLFHEFIFRHKNFAPSACLMENSKHYLYVFSFSGTCMMLTRLQPNAWQPFGFGLRACIVSTR